jgi:hypothetical protein
MDIDSGAQRALKSLQKSDPAAARKIQNLIDQVASGIMPQGSSRMTNGKRVRQAFGAVPHRVADGKLRVIFVPGQRIIALGYRRDVYQAIGSRSHWSN